MISNLKGLNNQTWMNSDYLQRFSGIARLYGTAALEKLHTSHIAVIGIGGVGSWSVEALARSGVGTLTLIDMDDICITNTKRQVHATDGQIGREKVAAMAERVKLINPEIIIHTVTDFFTEATQQELLDPSYDCVVDAIDSLKHKCLLIASCRERTIPLVVCGGAGGKSDPTCVSCADLAFATNDRLLKLTRKTLRRYYDYPSEVSREPFGATAIYSTQNPRFPWSDGTVRNESEPGSGLKLDCDSGFGTATQVTGAFGFAAAAEAIRIAVNSEQ